MKSIHYPRGSSYIWYLLLLTIFTTAAMAAEQPVDLGSAADFAVLASSTVINGAAVGTVVTGNLGVSPGTAVTGFPPGEVIGMIHAGDPVAAEAQADLSTAYDDAAGRDTAPITVAGNLGGQTLYPGLYMSTSSLAISSGDLVLDASGDPNAVFIFQMATTLTTTSGRQVILAGGAQPSKIFWQVGSSATFGSTSVFYGTVMAHVSITFNSGATLTGRALARTGGVTLDSNVITAPPVDTQLDISQCFCTPDWQFNLSGDTENWTNNSDLTALTVADGVLNTSVLGLNPQMFSQNKLDINAEHQTFVKIRMRVSAGTQGVLSFRSPSDVGFDPAKQIVFTIADNTSFVTYRLDLRKALGWTGTIDQLRLKPSDVNGAVVDIDYFSVCLPVVVKAPCWEFDQDGDVEGWSANTQIPDMAVTGGSLVGTTTGTNGWLFSPSNFTANADVQNKIVIRMRLTEGTRFRLHFMRSTDTTFVSGNSKRVPVTNNNYFVNYLVDLSTIPTYTGSIRRFAIEVVTVPGAAISIDYMRICMPTFDFTPSVMFDKDGNAEGWKAAGDSGAFDISGGYLKTTSTGVDPRILSPLVAVDTRFSRFFMGAMHINSGSFFELFYRHFGDTSFAADKKKRRDLFSNSDRRLYCVDLGTLTNYEALDVDRLRLDPAIISDVGTKVDFMGMLSQKREIGFASEFNVTGDTEGWKPSPDLTEPTVAEGILSTTSTGTDPHLTSPITLSINADNEKQVVVRMKVSDGITGRLYYRRSTDSDFSELRSMSFPISSNTDFATYNLDMSADPNWVGHVNMLRLDPTTSSGATVLLDSLQSYGTVQIGDPEWRWAQDGDALGWTAQGDVASLAVAGGVLTVTSSGIDPRIVSSEGLGISAAAKKWVIVKMKVTSAGGDRMHLFYKRLADNGFSTDRMASLAVPDNADYVIYKIYMEGDPNWTGTIDGFRLDPSSQAGSSAELDYILVP